MGVGSRRDGGASPDAATQSRASSGSGGVERARGAMICGVPVDDVTMEEAVDWIFDLVDDGRASDRSHQVATVNVDFVVNAAVDPALRSLMQRTSLSIPDGMPIVWGSALLGSRLRARGAGADLVPALAKRAAQHGATLAFYGASPGIAESAAALLRRTYPGANIVGDVGPSFGDVDELDLDSLSLLREMRPDICCVAFGNPKQERFIARFGQQLGIPVMIGVGGTLDFLVGDKRRAPVWMQRTGLEWLHRAATEPTRLGRRYMRDAILFGPRLAHHAWTGRRSRRAGAVVVGHDEIGDVVLDLTRLRVADNRSAADIASALRAAWLNGATVKVVGSSEPALRRIPGLAEMVALSTT